VFQDAGNKEKTGNLPAPILCGEQETGFYIACLAGAKIFKESNSGELILEDDENPGNSLVIFDC
jgi:hypothetical protein